MLLMWWSDGVTGWAFSLRLTHCMQLTSWIFWRCTLWQNHWILSLLWLYHWSFYDYIVELRFHSDNSKFLQFEWCAIGLVGMEWRERARASERTNPIAMHWMNISIIYSHRNATKLQRIVVDAHTYSLVNSFSLSLSFMKCTNLCTNCVCIDGMLWCHAVWRCAAPRHANQMHSISFSLSSRSLFRLLHLSRQRQRHPSTSTWHMHTYR